MLACVPELGHTIGHTLRRLSGPTWASVKQSLLRSAAGPWTVALKDSVSIMGITHMRTALATADVPKRACDLMIETLDAWDKGMHGTVDEWTSVAEGVHEYLTTDPSLRPHYKRAVHRLFHIIETARIFKVPVYSFLGQVVERLNQVMGRALRATNGDLRKALARVRAFVRLRSQGTISETGMSTVQCPRYR